jgi:hypothetical protein
MVTGLVCVKIAQNVAQPIFGQNNFITFTVVKSRPKFWDTSIISIKLPKENYRPKGKIRPIRSLPGVDVMITIFCEFRQFSAKKLAFFSKTNVMTKILRNSALI